MRKAFIEELTQIASVNKKVILLTGDLGFTVFEEFTKEFPKRFFNMGVAESNMISTSAGMALSGLVPFVYSIATFASMRGFEQIRSDVCFHNANVKIVGTGGGLSYGHAGFSHHSLEDIAILRSIPNMTIVCPSDPVLTGVATEAIANHHGPVYFRLGKKGEPQIYKKKPKFKIGKGIIHKEGKKVSIIATGNLVMSALRTSEILMKQGIPTTVIDMHTIKPIDKGLTQEVISSTQVLVTLEEHHITGGLGSAVAEIIADKPPKAIRFKRLGIPDTFIEKIGSQEYLRDYYGLTPLKISQTIKSLFS